VWTQTIAIGSQLFVSSVKKKLNDRAEGREIIASKHGSELGESVIPYNALFDREIGDIGPDTAPGSTYYRVTTVE